LFNLISNVKQMII